MATSGAPATWAGTLPRRTVWIDTFVFDWLFVVLGGLPFVLPVILLLGEQHLGGTDPIAWYLWTNTVISAPHVYSTWVRLGRKIHEGRLSGWLGLPAYAGCAAAIGLAAWGGRYVEALTAINVVQSFHYVRQVYGVHRFFTRGATDDAESRLFFLAYHLAMPLFVLGRWHTLWVVWRGQPSEYIIPVGFPAPVIDLCWFIAAVAVACGVVGLVHHGRRSGTLHVVALVNLGVFYVIHAYGFLSVEHYQRGFFAVTIYHAIQYLALVWMLEREGEGPGRAVATALPGVGGFAVFWLVILGGVLFVERGLLPAVGHLWLFLPGVLNGAVSAHHYLADAFLWRRAVGR